MSKLIKALKKISEAHREQTKNFSRFMSFLWGVVGWSCLTFLLILIPICFVNPLWFRASLLEWVVYELPDKLRHFREFLFRSYRTKMNLFDTIKG